MEANLNFVIVSARKELEGWLAETLRQEGNLVSSDSDQPERIIQLVDAISARAVFVDLTPNALSQDAALMEGLIAAKPLLPVVAIADTPDQSVILTALRAGARDFVSPDMRPTEVISLVRRVLSRDLSASLTEAADAGGKAVAIASARPGADAPMFALHLALAIQESSQDGKTLLLDLGVPAADTLTYLGIPVSYTFIDALRSLRRLDATLIDTAFGRHKSGLRLLAMPEEFTASREITSADLYVLLGVLRRHFSRIVVNLGGVPASDFLYVVLGRMDEILLLVEQSVPSCKQNMTLLQHLRENKVNGDNARLVVDRYLARIPPDGATIAKGFGLPLAATLPPSGMARLTMMNTGESLFESAPRDGYTLALRQLAGTVLGESGRAPEPAPGGWLRSVQNMLNMGGN